jgi:transposase-like protein
MATGQRKVYDADFKARVVMESLQHNVTLEQVKRKYFVAASVINRWRNQFRQNAHLAFTEPVKKSKEKARSESPEYLKRIIGDLTVENDILKKALSVWD